jgi:hypothetical protein
MMLLMEMIETVCVGCGVTFYQPADPGRRAEFHDGPCRSRTWREQRRQTLAAMELDQHLAWARDADRRYREKVRALRRAGKPAPEATIKFPGDTKEQARYRRICQNIAAAAAVGLELDAEEASQVLRTVRRAYKL